MKLLNKMERKFGRYAIHNLMYYIIIIQIAGYALTTMMPLFAARYLTLDVGAILHGQVWRLVTWIAVGRINLSDPFSLLFVAITLYLYYMIGRNLENVWGAFRFNVYYLSGILFNIIAAFILYFVDKSIFGGVFISLYEDGLTYINYSLFLAFACIYPDMELLYMFLIPIKMKYFGILYGFFIARDIIAEISDGNIGAAVAIVVAVLNFIIFFLSTRNTKRISPRDYNRKKKYKEQVRNVEKQTRHRCAVCGRTEQDDEHLEFRFCSKCDGNYEYCMEHLFTHQHVKKH